MSASASSLLRRNYCMPRRLADRTVRVRYGSEPTALGIVSVRTRYVNVGSLDGVAMLTPRYYHGRIFREQRYYQTVHWLGLAAFVLAFGLAGFVLGVPR